MNGLTDAELEAAMSALPGWKIEDAQLCKTFRLGSFREALLLIQWVGYDAEDLNHHPEIRNVFNRVRFALCTHDAGDVVTEKDVALATKIEMAAARLGAA